MKPGAHDDATAIARIEEALAHAGEAHRAPRGWRREVLAACDDDQRARRRADLERARRPIDWEREAAEDRRFAIALAVFALVIIAAAAVVVGVTACVEVTSG